MNKVYLLRMEDTFLFKIGFTKGDVSKRIKQLQTGCPNKIILVDFYESELANLIERSLHRFYSHRKKEGEWFCFEKEEELKFLRDCKDTDNNLKSAKNFYFTDF